MKMLSFAARLHTSKIPLELGTKGQNSTLNLSVSTISKIFLLLCSLEGTFHYCQEEPMTDCMDMQSGPMALEWTFYYYSLLLIRKKK